MTWLTHVEAFALHAFAGGAGLTIALLAMLLLEQLTPNAPWWRR
jgi:hypothetical protein